MSEKEVDQLYQKAKTYLNVDKKQLSKAIVKHVDKPPAYFEAVMNDVLPKYEKPPEYVKQKGALKRPGQPLMPAKKRVEIQSKKDYNPFREDKKIKYAKESYPKKPTVPPVKPPVVKPITVKPPLIKQPLPIVKQPPVIKQPPVKQPIIKKPSPTYKQPVASLINKAKGYGTILKTKMPVKPISLNIKRPSYIRLK